MEQEVIIDLLKKYNIDPSKDIVDCYLSLIKLGFNSLWLRNMCIIRKFDERYNTTTQQDIYLDLSIEYKTHPDSIRRIVAQRRQFEI